MRPREVQLFCTLIRSIASNNSLLLLNGLVVFTHHQLWPVPDQEVTYTRVIHLIFNNVS